MVVSYNSGTKLIFVIKNRECCEMKRGESGRIKLIE